MPLHLHHMSCASNGSTLPVNPSNNCRISTFIKLVQREGLQNHATSETPNKIPSIQENSNDVDLTSYHSVLEFRASKGKMLDYPCWLNIVARHCQCCCPLSSAVLAIINSGHFVSVGVCMSMCVSMCVNVCQSAASHCSFSIYPFTLFFSTHSSTLTSLGCSSSWPIIAKLVSCRNSRAIKDRNLTTSSWPKSDMMRQKKGAFHSLSTPT